MSASELETKSSRLTDYAEQVWRADGVGSKLSPYTSVPTRSLCKEHRTVAAVPEVEFRPPTSLPRRPQNDALEQAIGVKVLPGQEASAFRSLITAVG